MEITREKFPVTRLFYVSLRRFYHALRARKESDDDERESEGARGAGRLNGWTRRASPCAGRAGSTSLVLGSAAEAESDEKWPRAVGANESAQRSINASPEFTTN